VAPALSDAAVITRAICGEFCTCGTDKGIVAYVIAHDTAAFPHVRERSLVVRCCRHPGAGQSAPAAPLEGGQRPRC
ncbi:MAG: hypothetical protein ACR2L2_19675, partial [Acidobacteriota bacterium]